MKAVIARLSANPQLRKSIRNIFGFWPENIRLYEQAFRHSSVATEIKEGVKNSNERLEFLGDAVLGVIVAEFLFKKFPYKDEGFLTEMRSRMVSRAYLNKLGMKLGIDKLVEFDSSNKLYKSICGDTFEALVGAIYLDKGFEFARRVILNRIVKVHVDMEELVHQDLNYKSKLINWAQRSRKSISFDAREETRDRQRLFFVSVMINDEVLGEARGISKKVAEQLAAEVAWNKIVSHEDA